MMRSRTILLSLCSLFCVFLFISCEKDEDKNPLFKLEKDSTTIDAKGGEEQIKFTARQQWAIEDIPEWMHITPTTGDNSVGEVYMEVAMNEELAFRTAILTFSCGMENKTFEVKQLGLGDVDPFLELSENMLSMGSSGDRKTVRLTVNRPWEISQIPNWLTVTPTSGDQSSEIIITMNLDEDVETREAELIFTAGDIKKSLPVKQIGFKDYIRTPALPVFSFKQISFTPAMNHFEVEATTLFINQSIRDKIYLGNLVSHNASSHMDIPEFTGYTFNPITVSNSAGVKFTTYAPSQKEQQAYAQYIIEQNPKQSVQTVYDNGNTEFYDHRHLYVLGMVNLGIELDKVISGVSYKEQEMTRKYGLIYCFRQTLFTLDMDFPGPELIQEELKAADEDKGASYIGSVGYGRVELLVIESETNSREMKGAINKVISGESLSQHETDLIQYADISYVHFNKEGEVQVKKGHIDAVEAYKTGNPEYIYPISFELSEYPTGTMSTINFTFNVPE